MSTSNPQRASSWFSTRTGRRYNLELALIVLAKLALLALLYFLFIAPQPRADTTPAAMQRHLFNANSATIPAASP